MRSRFRHGDSTFVAMLPVMLLACGAAPETSDAEADLAEVVEAPGLRPLGGGSAGPITIAGSVKPLSITSDASFVYFLSEYASVGRVVKVSISGGVKTYLAEDYTYQLRSLVRIGTTLYWNTRWGDVRSMSVNGGRFSAIYDGQENAFWPRGLAGTGSAFTEPQFFFAMRTTELVRLESSGGVWTATQATQDAGPTIDPAYSLLSPVNIALTSEFALFSTDVTGYPYIWRVPRDGSTDAYIIAEAAPRAMIVTDGERIYYETATHIVSLSITGGLTTNVAPIYERLSGLAIRNGVVYWSCSDAGIVRKTEADGEGPVIVVADGEIQPRAVHADDSYVYWGTPTDLRRAPK